MSATYPQDVVEFRVFGHVWFVKETGGEFVRWLSLQAGLRKWRKKVWQVSPALSFTCVALINCLSQKASPLSSNAIADRKLIEKGRDCWVVGEEQFTHFKEKLRWGCGILEKPCRIGEGALTMKGSIRSRYEPVTKSDFFICRVERIKRTRTILGEKRKKSVTSRDIG